MVDVTALRYNMQNLDEPLIYILRGHGKGGSSMIVLPPSCVAEESTSTLLQMLLRLDHKTLEENLSKISEPGKLKLLEIWKRYKQRAILKWNNNRMSEEILYLEKIFMDNLERDFLVCQIQKIVQEINQLEQQLCYCSNQMEILRSIELLKSTKCSFQASLKSLCINIKFPDSDVYWAMHS